MIKSKKRLDSPVNRTKDYSRDGRWRGWGRCALAFLVPLAAGCPGTNPPPVDQTEPIPFAIELVAAGLTSPVALVSAGDATGRLFIVDQVGLIRILDANGELMAEPFLDLSSKLPQLNAGFDERGVLGLAFHPAYVSNGRFFVRYSAPRPGDATEPCNDPNGFIVGCHSEVLAEYQVSVGDPNRADAESEIVLLTVDKPQFNHNGGQIAFGPDGFLYVSFGDGGGANDNDFGHTPELGNGQDKTTLLGKILRIYVDSGGSYTVPPDNPFVGEEGSRQEIWAFGLRNPWRFSFDPSGARRLFVGDAGQDLFEEVHIVERGGNYGWNIREGAHCFDPETPANPPPQCPSVGAGGEPLIDPILEYAHVDDAGNPYGTAVIGGYVYRGQVVPELGGLYVFGDFSPGFESGDGTLLAAQEDTDGTWTLRELTVDGREGGRIERFILGFGQDAAGEVYVLTTQNVGPNGNTGEVYKIVAAGG